MKFLYIMMVINISSIQLSFAYDAVTMFEGEWQNWANEWKNSISTNNGGIQFSKRIDQQIGQPFTMPPAESIIPQFGPYGIDWQGDLTINSSGDMFYKVYDHISWLFSPDNVDMAISAFLAVVMEYYHCDEILQQIDQYMNLAQGYDNLFTTIQNHRYELAKYMMDNGSTPSNTNFDWTGNIFYSSSEENLKNWESNVNSAIKGKIVNNYSDDAINLINLMKTNNSTNIFMDPNNEYQGFRYMIVSNLVTIYQVTLDRNYNVKTKGGLLASMYDTKSMFQQYCYDKALGKTLETPVKNFINTYSDVIVRYGIDDRIEQWKKNYSGHGKEFDEITRDFMYGVYHDVIMNTIVTIDLVSKILTQTGDRTTAENVCKELRTAMHDFNIDVIPIK